ncbi:MAG TPA: hypothetical protein DCL35_03355 [Candidatus Omnitrophica bacterium]|nr:hypothetical protein [Candidatus Omnitrophota bacterium]
MTYRIRILAAVLFCIFVFFNRQASADDIVDLKAQISAMEGTIAVLKAKVEALEASQSAQSQEVKKVPQLQKEVQDLREESGESKRGLFDGLSVGGHLKLYMFDRAEGERNGVEQHNKLSAGLHHLYLYFRKEIEEWLALDVRTDTRVTASATPALGTNISRSTSSSVSTTIHQAFMTVRLPQQVEAKVGLFNPMFDEEYAEEVWWDQLYHMPAGIGLLQSWHDSGIEFYRNFDFSKWSLPLYITYLNGNTADKLVDNNEGKTILLHAEPEFFSSRLRLLGSLAYGKWDDDDKNDLWRWAAGLNFKYKKFDILGQYLYSRWDDLSLTGAGTEDGTRQGFYIKGLYRFNPKWRGIVQYSLVQLYNTGTSFMRTDKYNTWTFGLNYFITDSSVIIGQVDVGDARRSDGSEDLEYIRSTLGWRVTF